MSGLPARRAAAFARHDDETRIERAIGRVLSATAQPQQRPKAIFRVVPDGAQFGFSRSLIGIAAGPLVERSGPFGTERAAHALAKRAAARFASENPQFVVGLVGLEADVRRELPISTRFRAEWLAAGQTTEAPKCEECGKPTRFYQGKPVRFCPPQPGGPRSLCLIRHSNRIAREKDRTDPTSKKKKRQRSYKYLRNNPVRWAKHLEKNRALKARHRAEKGIPKRRKVERPTPDYPVEMPNCVTCGKPTRFRGGKPQLYCSKVNGRSRCAEAAAQKKLNADPTRKAARLERERERDRERYQRMMATPEGRERLRQKWRTQKPAIKPAEPLPTGSVLVTASPRSAGYELFSRIHAAVPSAMPHSLRMEIISETALLTLEGAEIKAAVVEASKSVRRNGSRLRYAKSIDDCFWLADETQDMPEMV